MSNKPTTSVVTPFKESESSKKDQVAEMFDEIAPSYDFLNHLLSMGIDVLWRRKAIRILGKYKPKFFLDIATGTGDFAIEALKINPETVVGVDISEKMLEVGREKLKKKKLDSRVELRYGDSENLQFEDNSVDAITVGFGVRNFENLPKGLSEMARVLKKGGAAIVLEPSIPQKFPLKQMFYVYFRGILPLIGRIVSKSTVAYTYLPESVKAFPNGKEFTEICLKSGFSKAQYHPLTLGICSMYILEK